jgi:hypothetical protein
MPTCASARVHMLRAVAGWVRVGGVGGVETHRDCCLDRDAGEFDQCWNNDDATNTHRADQYTGDKSDPNRATQYERRQHGHAVSSSLPVTPRPSPPLVVLCLARVTQSLTAGHTVTDSLTNVRVIIQNPT